MKVKIKSVDIFVYFLEVDNKEIKNFEFLTSCSIHQSGGESFDFTTGHWDYIQCENTYPYPRPKSPKMALPQPCNSSLEHQLNDSRRKRSAGEKATQGPQNPRWQKWLEIRASTPNTVPVTCDYTRKYSS